MLGHTAVAPWQVSEGFPEEMMLILRPEDEWISAKQGGEFKGSVDWRGRVTASWRTDVNVYLQVEQYLEYRVEYLVEFGSSKLKENRSEGDPVFMAIASTMKEPKPK